MKIFGLLFFFVLTGFRRGATFQFCCTTVDDDRPNLFSDNPSYLCRRLTIASVTSRNYANPRLHTSPAVSVPQLCSARQ